MLALSARNMLSLSTLSSFLFKGLVSSMGTVTSKSLVSFFGSVLVVAQVSVVRDFEASMSIVNSGIIKGTPTTKVLLEPTRCTTSSGIPTPPNYFIFGFFIIMLVSLVCTLGTKGSSSGTTTVKLPLDYPVLGGNQQIVFPAPPENWRNLPISDGRPPPPPPPEPGSTIKAKPPRKSYFLWLLFVIVVLLVLFAAWIKILYRMKLSPFSSLSRILSRLSVQSVTVIIACVGFIKWITTNITWVRVVNTPAAIYLVISSLRGLDTRVSFNFPMDPPALPCSWFKMAIGGFEHITAAIQTTKSWIVDIPWPQARMIAVFCVAFLLYLLVVSTSRRVKRATYHVMLRFAYDDGLDVIIKCLDITTRLVYSFLILFIATWTESILVFGCYLNPITLFYDGYLLATIIDLFVPWASPFLDIVSPIEKLTIFGPASMLTILLTFHIVPWLFTWIFRLFSQRRHARAAYLAVNVLVAAVIWRLFFTDLTYRTVRAIIGCTAPVWSALPMGYKIVLVTPPIAHYLGIYVVRFTFPLVHQGSRFSQALKIAGTSVSYNSLFSLPALQDSVRKSASDWNNDAIRQPIAMVNTASTADTTPSKTYRWFGRKIIRGRLASSTRPSLQWRSRRRTNPRYLPDFMASGFSRASGGFYAVTSGLDFRAYFGNGYFTEDADPITTAPAHPMRAPFR
ncbi:hypothetical protein C8J57DRAFT_1710724 [Mycena rebaudengoi]|nr:hypothetical protein C8J57DRAFT_1710724 [Mycena rebaudengoi]